LIEIHDHHLDLKTHLWGCPKRACKKNDHHRICHTGPRSGISCWYQSWEISFRVQKMSASSARWRHFWTALWFLQHI